MPGIIGEFLKDNIRIRNFYNELLIDNSLMSYQDFINTDKILLSGLDRKNKVKSLHVNINDFNDEINLLYGHCFDSLTYEQLNAETFKYKFDEEGYSCLNRFEGAFHFVSYNRKINQLLIINDRLATLPFFYIENNKEFCFAPGLKYLLNNSINCEPDISSIISFLSCGFNLGNTTIYKNVKLLSPATVMIFDLISFKLKEINYWKLEYDVDYNLSVNDHIERLDSAIVESVKLLTKEDSGSHGLLLSGGWDSRGILGNLMRIGRPPKVVVTNGRSDQIPGMDTYIAKKLSEFHKLNYKFSYRKPQINASRLIEGIYKAELTTDNNPENFGLNLIPNSNFENIDYILRGDVIWGSGDRALNRDMSINKVIPYPLDSNVKTILNQNIKEISDKQYESQIENIFLGCNNSDWTDRKDFFWQMNVVNRYVFGLSVSDEEYIQVRRPLLTGKIFDVYTKVPIQYRINKNLYVQYLKRYFPKDFSFGRNHVSHIYNYYSYMAIFIRQRILLHLISGHDLFGILNINECKKMLEAFEPVDDFVKLPSIKDNFKNKIKDRYFYLWHRNKYYKENNVKQIKHSINSLIFRIYLLLEWFYKDKLDDKFKIL